MSDEKRIETTPVQHIRNLVSSIKDEKLTITYYDPIEPSTPEPMTCHAMQRMPMNSF